MGNTSKTSEAAQINKSLCNMENMSVPQLEDLASQIGGVINRGKIKTDVTYDNYEKKYRITTLDGVEISREYIETNYKGTSTSIQEVALSSDNVKSLNGALAAVNLMIQIKKAKIEIHNNLLSSINTLHKIGNNPKIITSVDEALELSIKFLGPHEETAPIGNRSDSFLRLKSKDGKRQVRWDIEPKMSHCKGQPHFNFEFLDNENLKLQKELDFEVKSNYHIFIGKK